MVTEAGGCAILPLPDDPPYPLQILLIRRHGQGIASFVFWVAGVAADVGEGDVVDGQQLVEPLPEIGVFQFEPFSLVAAALLRYAVEQYEAGRVEIQVNQDAAGAWVPFVVEAKKRGK